MYIIFNLEDNAAHTFIGEIEKKLKTTNSGEKFKDQEVDDGSIFDFELAILELSLEHIEGIRPAFEFFLEQVELDQESNRLGKLLAIKKNVIKFLQNVQHVMKVLQNIYNRDKEMIEFYLSVQEN